MIVLIKGLEMPETEYMDVRIFRDGTATLATGTKPYYRELKAEPVRHGKWEPVSDGVKGEHFECCVCKHPAFYAEDGVEELTVFCPNCGADMRGEEE